MFKLPLTLTLAMINCVKGKNMVYGTVFYKYILMSHLMRKPAICKCETKGADQLRSNAPVISIPPETGDSGGIAGLKCRGLTCDVSRLSRGCAGVLTSRQYSGEK